MKTNEKAIFNPYTKYWKAMTSWEYQIFINRETNELESEYILRVENGDLNNDEKNAIKKALRCAKRVEWFNTNYSEEERKYYELSYKYRLYNYALYKVNYTDNFEVLSKEEIASHIETFKSAIDWAYKHY